eukprot:986509-Pelagomonas_calceolata.AAC.1
MGIRRVDSNSPCLTLVMRVDRSLLKSASAIAKYQASQATNFVAKTRILCAGPELATDTSTAPAPTPKLTCLPNSENALQSHMHTENAMSLEDLTII